MLASNKPNRLLVIALLAVAMTGCASTKPVAYSGIASSTVLTTNAKEEAERIPYSYATTVDWRKYTSIIVDPVEIYKGRDQQFEDMSAADKSALASYMQSQFSEKLKTRFAVVNSPARDTLRLKLTLTGANTTTPVLGPLLRFDIAGGLYNGVQAIRGREGAMTGYVIYAVEIFDAQSNRLLKAYITKQYPNAMNVVANFGALTASKTGIDKGADALVEQLR